MTANRLLLLTGPPGIGKTTVLRKVARGLEPSRLRGFLTGEIREGGRRLGFSCTSFDGRTGLLAHAECHSRWRVGRYGVDLESFESVAIPAVEPAGGSSRSPIFLIDEIGKAECYSRRFIDHLRRLLDSGVTAVATVALRGGGFMREVKERPGVEIWHVSRESRDGLPARVLRWIEGHEQAAERGTA